MDFPHNWLSLQGDIIKGLNSQDIKGAYTGLLSLLSVVKRYAFCSKKADRDIMNGVLQPCIPQLGKLMLLSLDEAQKGVEEALDMIK
jgi:hypothetical protein